MNNSEFSYLQSPKGMKGESDWGCKVEPKLGIGQRGGEEKMGGDTLVFVMLWGMRCGGMGRSEV